MKLGINSEGMQRANRNLIIQILLEQASISRIDLSRRTDLNRATITNIINDFLECGIVKESDAHERGEGRKNEQLKLWCKSALIISARFTRDFFSAYVFGISGEVKLSRTISIDKNADIHETFKLVHECLRSIIEQGGEENILGMCVGVSGPYIRGKRNVAIVSEFEELSRVDFQNEIKSDYPFFVVTEHDTQLSALAEWKRLDPKIREKENSLIGIQSIGIGIGAGLILNGKMFDGAAGFAGEVGHMGINFNGTPNNKYHRGIFESYASTGEVRAYVAEHIYEYPDTRLRETSDYEQIREAYAEGEPLAVAAMDNMAWKLAYGLTNLVYILNPDRIVLAEDYPKIPRFINKVRECMGKMLRPELLEIMTIEYTDLEIDSTILGGYYFVLNTMLKQDVLLDCLKKICVDG